MTNTQPLGAPIMNGTQIYKANEIGEIEFLNNIGAYKKELISIIMRHADKLRVDFSANKIGQRSHITFIFGDSNNSESHYKFRLDKFDSMGALRVLTSERIVNPNPVIFKFLKGELKEIL